MSPADRRWRDLQARNLTLPGIQPGKAAFPTRDLPHQKPCDIGLFSDDANQLDLVEMCQEPTND